MNEPAAPEPRTAARQAAAAWWQERSIDLALRESDPPDAPPEPAPYRRRAEHPQPRPGDIHLLIPHPAPLDDEPAYVLVTAARGGKIDLVPFGRYRHPATPGEWRTGLTATPLQVLCLWNHRTGWPTERLLSGRVGTLAAKRLNTVLRLLNHVLGQEPITGNMPPGLGPPLEHPLDPRHDYLDEERARIDAYESTAPALVVLEGKPRPAAWRLAAEGRPVYGRPGDPDRKG
jgi:hypothetical protein